MHTIFRFSCRTTIIARGSSLTLLKIIGISNYDISRDRHWSIISILSGNPLLVFRDYLLLLLNRLTSCKPLLLFGAWNFCVSPSHVTRTYAFFFNAFMRVPFFYFLLRSLRLCAYTYLSIKYFTLISFLLCWFAALLSLLLNADSI